MPDTLEPIPTGVAITNKDASISTFFRLRWQSLIDRYQHAPTIATLAKRTQTAALPTTAVVTVKAAGLYRLSYYLRKTTADGVSSSAQVTWGWTESAIALTEDQPALTTDTTTAQQSGTKLVWADAGDLTVAVAYASNTPNRMAWRLDVTAEQLV